MWNTLSIQYNSLIEEEWDEHYRVTCEYGSDFWKTVTFPSMSIEWVHLWTDFGTFAVHSSSLLKTANSKSNNVKRIWFEESNLFWWLLKKKSLKRQEPSCPFKTSLFFFRMNDFEKKKLFLFFFVLFLTFVRIQVHGCR